MLFYGRAQALDRKRRAHWIEAVAVGYGGCKTKEGGRAYERAVTELTRD